MTWATFLTVKDGVDDASAARHRIKFADRQFAGFAIEHFVIHVSLLFLRRGPSPHARWDAATGLAELLVEDDGVGRGTHGVAKGSGLGTRIVAWIGSPSAGYG
jgi:hypothetical protein